VSEIKICDGCGATIKSNAYATWFFQKAEHFCAPCANLVEQWIRSRFPKEPAQTEHKQ
jgi:hypothetical protein